MFTVSKSNEVSFSVLYNWHKNHVKFYLTSYVGHAFLAHTSGFFIQEIRKNSLPDLFHRCSLASALITVLPPFWLQHQLDLLGICQEGSCPSQGHQLLCHFRSSILCWGLFISMILSTFFYKLINIYILLVNLL